MQFRSGILCLRIEKGRWVAIGEEDRLCYLCDLNEIENEVHFALYCPYYHDLRLQLFDKADVKEMRQDAVLLPWLFEYDIVLFADFTEKGMG